LIIQKQENYGKNQIIQLIENKVITGSVILRTSNGSDQKSLFYDFFGNMSGINDFYANRLRSGEITLNDKFRIYMMIRVINFFRI
jgi:hypothetical protein